jgi:hypothetical protein
MARINRGVKPLLQFFCNASGIAPRIFTRELLPDLTPNWSAVSWRSALVVSEGEAPGPSLVSSDVLVRKTQFPVAVPGVRLFAFNLTQVVNSRNGPR